MSSNIPLLLFAKAPIAGQVKTRLQSHCSARQAADIAAILMEESIRVAVSHWPGPVYLSVWLDHEHEFFMQMLDRYPIEITRQCGGDLGAKMQHALQKFGYPAAVMGCDVPHISAKILTSAHRLLSDGQSVIGPSCDGGYYLLGLTQAADDLFNSKTWGSDSVLSETLSSAAELGLLLTQLEPLNDIDEWPDLLAAADKVAEIANYLARTGS